MFSNFSQSKRFGGFESGKKLCAVSGLLIVIMLFGDTIILFIGHCLHILFEIVALWGEHWLQATFGMTGRQSEIAFFYISVTAGGLLVWRILKNLYLKSVKFYVDTSLDAKKFKITLVHCFKVILIFFSIYLLA